MKIAYPTFILEEEKDNVFYVCVPDLGIYTEGNDFYDAIYMARDAIGLSLITKEDLNQEIPKPSTVEEARRLVDEDFIPQSSGICTFVDVDVDTYRRKLNKKTVRKNVSLPEWLDYEAKKANINVSKVLQKALKAELGLS